jgi:hypothetical protein
MTVWTSQSRTTLMPRTTCRCASALRYGCSGPDRHRAGGKRWRYSGTTCRSASAWATHGEALSSELLAAMVAISAAAHALDALYGQLVTAQIKANGPRGDVGRAAHIRECLKRRFNTGKKDREWVEAFGWLFSLRDAAVHAEEKHLPAVQHPAGVGYSGPLNADYCAEGAGRAVQLLMDVLETCVRNPKRSDSGAVQWAKDYGPGVGILLTDHAVARDALPLVAVGAASRN